MIPPSARPLKRIAIINDIAGVGSLQTKILNDAGYDAAFIDLPKPAAAWPWLAKLAAMPYRLALYVPIIRRLRRSDYDLVHIHFVSQGFIGILIGKPFVLHAHGHDVRTNLSNPLLRWISRLAMKHAIAIFYVTPDLRQYLAGYAGKAFLLPNPLPPVFFENVQPPTRLRRVLIFTRLDPIKGPQELFSVADELSGLVDVTTISWGLLASRLRAQHSGRIQFIDRVSPDRVPALIDQFDAVIGQMKLGILSLSELEAMARGRMVFMRLDRSLYADDPPPVVDVASGDELVRELRRLQSDPEEMRRISDAGREWVRRRHGLDGYLTVLRRGYADAGDAGDRTAEDAPAPVPVATLVSVDGHEV